MPIVDLDAGAVSFSSTGATSTSIDGIFADSFYQMTKYQIRIQSHSRTTKMATGSENADRSKT